jgi:hypothetical protein
MQKRKFGVDWSKTMKKINEQANTKKNFQDERLYYPLEKDDGSSSAIIRFLPSKDTDLPWVQLQTHGIQGPGGWFIKNCPTTLNNPCPVCKSNSLIWNDNDEETARKLTKGKTRKTNYYSNILVVKDPMCKENEGKVFLYRYGVKIYKKIMEQMNPVGGDDGVETPIMVFDYYEGANFKLIMKKQKVGNKSMPNYDSSKFDGVSCVGTDEEIEKIHNSLYSLAEFITPDKFSSYDELAKQYAKVCGEDDTQAPAPAQRKKPKAQAEESDVEETVEETVDTDKTFDGDDETFFENLQKED